MIDLIIDSSAKQSLIEEAGAHGVRWMRENLSDALCAIIVYDESQVQVADGQYLPGQEHISWKFRAKED